MLKFLKSNFLSELNNSSFLPIECIEENDSLACFINRNSKRFKAFEIKCDDLSDIQSFITNLKDGSFLQFRYDVSIGNEIDDKTIRASALNETGYISDKLYLIIDEKVETTKNLGVRCKKEILEKLISNFDHNEIKFQNSSFHHKGLYGSILSIWQIPNFELNGLVKFLRLELTSPFSIFINIEIPNQLREISRISRQSKIDKNNANEALLQESAHKTLLEIESNFEKLIKVDVKICFIRDSEAKLNDVSKEAENVFRRINGKLFRENISLQESLASLFSFNKLHRYFYEKVSNINFYLPKLSQEVEIDAKAGKLLLHKRNGNLTEIDLFNDKHSANHLLISGKSGSGKSFLVNSLIMALSQNENVNITLIDVGGSFKGTFQEIGGKEIEIVLDKQGLLSPFTGLTKDNYKENLKRIAFFLKTLIVDKTMTKLEEAEILENTQHWMNEYLPKSFEDSVKYPLTLDSLINCLNPKHKKILSPWMNNGANGKIFSKSKEQFAKYEYYNFSKINEAASDKSFIQGVFAAVASSIWGRFSIAKENNEKHVFIIDEAPLFLAKSSELISEMLATFRKECASIILCTQSIVKLIESCINPNAFNLKAIFSLEENDDFKKFLNLEKNEIEKITSLKMNRESFYSEFYYMDDLHREEMVFKPSMKEYWLSTTHPKDKDRIQKHIKMLDVSYKTACLLSIIEEQEGHL